MTTNPFAAPVFTNPVADRDIPDPDAITLSGGGYALVASSFDRRPGLPLWRSDDLVTWYPVGFAGGHRPDAPADGGVWAPSIREHDGRLFIVWGDPDVGIFVVDAPSLEGPWSDPRLVKAGKGLIDACPVWIDDRAFIVHAYARSRAGFANRVDVFEADPTLTTALTGSHVVIDGDGVPGCSVLEGPKVYLRDGELWIFAPAGGVATGWQYAFRSPGWDGPWEHRVILEQGDTPVNGPHQGAWVRGAGGEEWFLHFQAKGALGRVLHLQPLSWSSEGWPLLGAAVDGGAPEPVVSWPLPTGAGAAVDDKGDRFDSDRLSPAWHGRERDPDDLVVATGDERLVLEGDPDAAVLRPIDGAVAAVEVSVLATVDAAAALVIADAERHELLVHPADDEGVHLVEVESAGIRTRVAQAGGGVRIGIRFAHDTAAPSARFTLDGSPVGEAIPLSGRRWTGTEWGLAARVDAAGAQATPSEGTATFGPVEAVAR